MEQRPQGLVKLHGAANLFHLDFGRLHFRLAWLHVRRFPRGICTSLFLLVLHDAGNFLRRTRLFITAVVLLLLGRGQGLILHFQLHRLIDVLPLAEPENQVVAFFQALGRHPRFLIQFREFIRPLLDILTLLESLQGLDLLLDWFPPRTKYLVTQQITVRILRGRLDEFVIIINRFIYIFCLQRQHAQAIQNLPAALGPLISDIENVITFLIFPVLFIDVTDVRQHRGVAHPPPVNRVRDFRGLVVRAVLHKLKHLLAFQLIFVFIHREFLQMYLSHSTRSSS